MHITVPLSWPGIRAGCMLVFIPAVGRVCDSGAVRPPESLMIGKVLWTEFFNNRDWPVASAVAIALLLVTVAPSLLATRPDVKRVQPREWLKTRRFLGALVGVGVRLCIPICADPVAGGSIPQQSRLVTVWGGFSHRVYGKLFANEQILQAAWLSLRIAALNATGRTCSAPARGLALARFRQFRGRTLLVTMTTAPLVMPEVIHWLSLLLLFVALEQAIVGPQAAA